MSNWDSDKVSRLAQMTEWKFEIREYAMGNVYEYYNSADATVCVVFSQSSTRAGDYISAVRHSSTATDSVYRRESRDEDGTELLGLVASWFLS